MSLNSVITRLEADPAYLQSHWSLPPEDARFLYLLARIGRFQRMLEIGTSIGYSALHLVQAATFHGGHLTSIDASLERQCIAQSNLEEAGLASYVSLRHGDALTVLSALEAEGARFDFIFIDARKSEYVEYLAFASRLLDSGGVLLADNTRSHRDKMTDFIETIHASLDWEVSDLETPNGFVLARKGSFSV